MISGIELSDTVECKCGWSGKASELSHAKTANPDEFPVEWDIALGFLYAADDGHIGHCPKCTNHVYDAELVEVPKTGEPAR